MDLESRILINKPYIYILGDTAPEPGITIRKNPALENITVLLEIEGSDTVHDILIRHVRLRYGDGPSGASSPWMIAGGYNIVMDHLSCSWGKANMGHIYLDDPTTREIYNVTIQHCLFAESFYDHPTGFNAQNRRGGPWDGIHHISFHHNVFVMTGYRNPLFTAKAEIINNIVYNWRARVGGCTRNAQVDFINNLLREGPNTDIQAVPGTSMFRYQIHLDDGPNTAEIYSDGNYMDGHTLQQAEDDDFWFAETYDLGVSQSTESLPEQYKRAGRLYPTSDVAIEAATDLMNTLLGDVGATLPSSDSVDARQINDVVNRTAILDNTTDLDEMADVGGWPAVQDL